MAETVLFTETQIAARVRELAAEIDRDHDGAPPLLLSILGGGVILTADLIRHLTIAFDCSFLSVAALGSTDVRVLLDSTESVSGRRVILVDGAIISGRTHVYLNAWLTARGAASVDLCAIIVKQALPPTLTVRYAGFRTDEFAVGYGIAHGGKFRGLPHIARFIPASA